MKILFMILAIAIMPMAQASFKGVISFSEAEKAQHKMNLNLILETSQGCLQSTLDRHQSFYARWGISPYFGDNSEFGRLTEADRALYLQRMGLPASLVNEMESISCVGLSISCLKKGLIAAGQNALWDKINAFTVANDVDGQAIQAALRELGWQLLYWNPDPSKNERVDAWEQYHYPGNPLYIWGRHAERWLTVLRESRYDSNIVDDYRLLVDFKTTVPERFKRVPFSIGTAHGGYHVFPGMLGQVIEGHSTRNIRDKRTVESSPFNPFSEGGGPRGSYFSGLIVIPPGY